MKEKDKNNNTDKQVLEHMLKYIGYIEEANERLNGSLDALQNDNIYRKLFPMMYRT